MLLKNIKVQKWSETCFYEMIKDLSLSFFYLYMEKKFDAFSQSKLFTKRCQQKSLRRHIFLWIQLLYKYVKTHSCLELTLTNISKIRSMNCHLLLMFLLFQFNVVINCAIAYVGLGHNISICCKKWLLGICLNKATLYFWSTFNNNRNRTNDKTVLHLTRNSTVIVYLPIYSKLC